MVTVFDMAQDGTTKQDFPSPPPEEKAPDVWEILKKETGPGTVDSYLAHPLNVTGSNGLAQVLRGLTGLLGSLNYAVVDIIMGMFRALMEGRKNAGQSL